MPATQLLVVSEAWHERTWDEWVGVVGTLLGLVGLYITWRQARAARTAAEAARKAVTSTQEELRGNHLLVQIGQLRWVTSALDDAMANNKPDVARLLLESWRYSAGQIHGLILKDPTAGDVLLTQVQESIGQAVVAGSAVLARPSRNVSTSCSQARQAIGVAFDALNQWSGQRAHMINQQVGGNA